MTIVEDLRRTHPNRFTDTWADPDTLNFPTPAFIVVSGGGGLAPDTIGDSNVFCVYEDLAYEFDVAVHKTWRPYVDEVWVTVQDMEESPELAEAVKEIVWALDRYPVYNEEDYCNRENKELNRYIEEDLEFELSLYLDDDAEHCMAWLNENPDVLWGFNDGSVDDYPFNVESIADAYQERTR